MLLKTINAKESSCVNYLNSKMSKLIINMNMNSIQCAITSGQEETENDLMNSFIYFFADLVLAILLEVQKQAAQRNNQRPLKAPQSRCHVLSSPVGKIRSPWIIPRCLSVKTLLSDWTSSKGNTRGSAAGEVPLDVPVPARGITSVTLCMIGLAF